MMTRALRTAHDSQPKKHPKAFDIKLSKLALQITLSQNAFGHLFVTVVPSFQPFAVRFAFINLLCDDVRRANSKLHRFQWNGSIIHA